MTPFEQLLLDVDAAWGAPPPGRRIHLRILGSVALFLQSDYRRGTKDGDVVETYEVSGAVADRLRLLAGQGTPLHRAHRLYLDVVPRGLPFLPPEPLWWPLDDLPLRNFQASVLDPVDVVISKIPRFRGNDRLDIEAACSRGIIEPTDLVERFLLAMDGMLLDARCEDLPTYVERLHTIERDMLGVDETFIEMPPWIAD